MLLLGRIQNLATTERTKILNFNSLNEKYPRLHLIPPLDLGSKNEYDFDMKYAYYLLNDPNAFIDLMQIMYPLYQGEDVFLLVDDERFEQGINGLTAARLVEAYHVPAIAMGPSDDPDIYKGSARSVPGFNIFEALNECKDLLIGFGGHPMAAGLVCRKENIGALRDALEKKAAEKGVEKDDYRRVDFIFDPADLDKKFISEMNALAPFGADYEKPVVGFKGTVYRRYVMKDKHVKYVVRGGARNNCYIQLIWWNSLEREQKLLPDMMGKEVRAIGYPNLNEFNGEVSVQFVANEVGEAG